MKKFVLFAAAVIALSAYTAVTNWTGDKAHSSVGFSITHMGINDINGYFKEFETSITTNKEDFSDAVVTFSADVASISTGIDARDKHLVSPDFFNAEKFPKITFKSTAIKGAGKDKYKLTGDLTFNGVTKPVTLDLWYRGTIENPMSKKPTSGFQVTGTIKRSDFGFASQFPAPMLSDEVKIKADGEFAKQ